MENKIYLIKYDISEELFDNILLTMKSYIKNVNDIEDYCTGYNNKNNIYYDGKSMILKECLLFYFAKIEDPVTDWKQCIVRKTPNQKKPLIKSIDGSRAYLYIMTKLKNYYTAEEIDACLKSHESEYDFEKIQYHYTFIGEMLNIYKHDNCVKYDINGAHQDALIEIFPKAKPFLMKLYNERKINPVNKQYVNYFVGMLCRKGYRKTYNWIVQRTSKMLLDAINYVDGSLVYANTDGFIVQNPKRKLEASTELGKFKLEYEGTAYTYAGENYWCYQIEKDGVKDITGNVLYSVRDKIDLKKNTVVKYDRFVDGNVVLAKNVEVKVI